MKKNNALAYALLLVLAVFTTAARADEYSDTIALFKNAGQSARMFESLLWLCRVSHHRQGRHRYRWCSRNRSCIRP